MLNWAMAFAFKRGASVDRSFVFGKVHEYLFLCGGCFLIQMRWQCSAHFLRSVGRVRNGLSTFSKAQYESIFFYARMIIGTNISIHCLSLEMNVVVRKLKNGWLAALCFMAVLAGWLALLSCSPKEPVRLGFLGGLSGRFSDLGLDGRDGALLAVEMRNKAGGLKGRTIQLITRDDQQNPEVASLAMAQLIDLKVSAIIGPMTSSMAVVVVPQANSARIVLLSPTVTASSLSGLDDFFFRIVAATTLYAKTSADDHFQRLGLRKIAVIADQRNAAYTDSWFNDYHAAFVARGGKVVKNIRYLSGPSTLFADLARQLVNAQADGVLIIANSVDAAMLIQHVRRFDASIAIATSEWAATERLIELGGQAVEGITVAQFIDRQSTQPTYVKFRQDYAGRFGREPGFSGLTAFEATNVVLDALEQQLPGQSLKDALIARKRFPGVQEAVVFDDYGDTSRATYPATVAGGLFITLH